MVSVEGLLVALGGIEMKLVDHLVVIAAGVLMVILVDNKVVNLVIAGDALMVMLAYTLMLSEVESTVVMAECLWLVRRAEAVAEGVVGPGSVWRSSRVVREDPCLPRPWALLLWLLVLGRAAALLGKLATTAAVLQWCQMENGAREPLLVDQPEPLLAFGRVEVRHD